ncbi:MAG: hypothetical protein ABFD91_18235 [Anaerohalosphaeraceae bacterium]
MSQSTLDSKKILDTICLLKVRIEERFPDSSLGQVCGELTDIARQSDQTIALIHRPSYSYRIIVFVFILILTIIAGLGFSQRKVSQDDTILVNMVQVLEGLCNVVVLIGGAILFLVSIENRIKRKKVIKAVNALRCLAHVIDAHQLTKDPCFLDPAVLRTNHSPQRSMTSFQLSRYLDYCSEMLSLVSKVAFLYVQDYQDSVATEAVNDLEDLTNGLSTKIWQKITTVNNISDLQTDTPQDLL